MDDLADTALAQAAAALAQARHVAVLTGAGISAESGLSTFRGKTADEDSLWARYDPAELATPRAFAADPDKVGRWYDWRRQACLAAAPNAGHRALVTLAQELEARGGSLRLVTQNVDSLHARAGSEGVVELHGSILRWRCTRCGTRVMSDAAPFPAFPVPSPCHPERGLLRPDVVWFGEPLPEAALAAAFRAAARCDLFLAIGTSAQVYPAASMIDEAVARRIPSLEINAEPTPQTRRVRWALQGKAGELLPRLLERARSRPG